ncbi:MULTISPECIES: hypothetical protein [Fusobacterium]|uniref:hypothetical protein n=1 Tax=Fusobacterium TaxID=848 RepID=UPI000449BA11|nr:MULTISPECIES: hypothetical protein [Fusobacterium]EUB36304.1 hypothetical protein HMPREF1501_1326 [Fusobacterium sp. OBRC1]WRL72404.1 hypothetical protein VKN77_08705 [Fusobacterium polymorphum]
MENKNLSREKALPFSLEKLETMLNNLILRDTYSNKILNEPLSEFYKREVKKEEYKDNFLQIVEYTLNSLEKIAKNPKKELLKVSELQPINEIRGTDYKTMVWLGNKPGKTLAEKIGVKGKILAPKNKYSVDKKENRIAVYYFKEAYKILEEKYQRYIENQLEVPENLKIVYDKFYRVKREMINNEMFFIDRPIDFTPNNTLIDHRDYSVINKGLKYLKEYKENLSYDESKLLTIAKNIVFFKLCYYIAKLENIDIFDDILKIEEMLKKDKKEIEFYFNRKEPYIIKVISEKSKRSVRIEIQEMILHRTKKIILKNKNKINKIDIQIINFNKNEYPFYKLKIQEKEYNFNDDSFKNLLLESVKDLDLIGNIRYKANKEKSINEDIFINFNSQNLLINDEILEIRSYNKKLGNFMKVKDYFISENNEQDCYHISELISSDENIENFSKYLKNIKDKKNINNKNICIYPTLEALDSDNQKILKSIFDSNFDTNYPIWRSILATYSIKNSDNRTWLKNKDKFFVLDLNTEIPSINIIEIEGNVYKHHPALSLEEIDEENNIINEISLKSYLRKYLEEYIISYNIEMNENEKNNLISSGKIYKIIFDNKKYLSNDKKFFLVRDKDVLKNVGSEFYSSLQKFISKFFENKIRKLLIISDYLGEKYSINKMVIKTMKEEELLFGKEEIIEKIKSGKTPWSEYLPNLSLETIKDGHFYNLELIKKNQGVEIILGKEAIINISEELVLPKDKKIIRFPLYSRDSNNKKLYFLEIRSDLFPLKENLVVNLEVIYSYGNKEPYKIDLKAKDIDSSKFSTKWTENIDDLEIKSLDFLGENNKNDSDGIVGINEIIKKIKTDNSELKDYLKRKKNKLRTYVIEEIEKGNLENIKNILDRNSKIQDLLEILNEKKVEKDLLDEIAIFLASFGILIYDKIKVNDLKFDYRKRTTLFLYKLNNQLKLKDILGDKDKKYGKYIETIAEIAWLDKTFINNLIEKEPEIIKASLKFLKNDLKYFKQEFKKEYDRWNENAQLWKITNRFKSYLEFILAILTINDKEKLKEMFKVWDKRDILKILYDIKDIDRRIQIDYPQLREEFNKRIKLIFNEIGEQKEEIGLESMSDLAYTVYCYLTGNDGSEAIKIKEVINDFDN